EARRRARIFSFPQQLAALKDVLNQFVTEVFGGTRMDRRALLRGVHLTSGTQEGTPIDRLLGSVGRAFAFESQEVPHAALGRGKAYFVERLLKEVILPESGLAGVNRRLELQIAGAQLVTYAGLAVITVFLAAALMLSYSGNSDYLESVRDALAKVDASELRPAAPMDQLARGLDQVRNLADVANRYPQGAPWSARWGLYAGNSLAPAEDLKGHSARSFAAEVRPTPVDNDAVEQARSTIRHATLAALMYGEMKLDHAGDTQGALRLDNAAGVGLNQALARRGGRSW